MGLVLSGEGTCYQTSICRGSTRPCFYNGHLSPRLDLDGYLHLKCQDSPLPPQPLREPRRRQRQAQRGSQAEPKDNRVLRPQHITVGSRIIREKLPRSPPFSSCKHRAGALPHPGPWDSPGVVTTLGGPARKRSMGVSPGPTVCGKEPIRMRTEGLLCAPPSRGLRIAPGSGPREVPSKCRGSFPKKVLGFI